MKTNNIVEEVNEKIAKLLSDREKELAEIQMHIDEETMSLNAANKAMDAATDSTDLGAYERAKAEKTRAETALEMYSARYKKVKNLDYITEEESDAIIASLQRSDHELSLEFVRELNAALETVRELLQRYEREKQKLRITVERWTKDIHRNYLSPTTIFKETGTHRSPKPIPVSAGALCREHNITKQYLDHLLTIDHSI
jgi:hypothetical protein